MGNTFEQRYLRWLQSQIAFDKRKNYDELCAILHSKEFVWFVANDDNRIEDGRQLRVEFSRGHHNMMQGCSILELVVALSRRCAFAGGGHEADWAMQLLENLGLHRMSSHIGKTRADQIDDILERLIWRNYEPDGEGGFFPLSWPEEDQRKVEIWYQMSAYINEIVEL